MGEVPPAMRPCLFPSWDFFGERSRLDEESAKIEHVDLELRLWPEKGARGNGGSTPSDAGLLSFWETIRLMAAGQGTYTMVLTKRLGVVVDLASRADVRGRAHVGMGAVPPAMRSRCLLVLFGVGTRILDSRPQRLVLGSGKGFLKEPPKASGVRVDGSDKGARGDGGSTPSDVVPVLPVIVEQEGDRFFAYREATSGFSPAGLSFSS